MLPEPMRARIDARIKPGMSPEEVRVEIVKLARPASDEDVIAAASGPGLGQGFRLTCPLRNGPVPDELFMSRGGAVVFSFNDQRCLVRYEVVYTTSR